MERMIVADKNVLLSLHVTMVKDSVKLTMIVRDPDTTFASRTASIRITSQLKTIPTIPCTLATHILINAAEEDACLPANVGRVRKVVCTILIVTQVLILTKLFTSKASSNL